MNVKKCLIVDVETTGIEPKDHKIIEIGAILYSLETNAALASTSILLPSDRNEAEEINGISIQMLEEIREEFGIIATSLKSIAAMAAAADVFIAHRASFDKGHLTGYDLPLWSSKPWLCTKEDFRFPVGKPGSSLVELALAHKVPVWDNHRALTDIRLISSIFQTYSTVGLRNLFEHALLPRDYYVALTGFAEKEKPKTAGFSWSGDPKKVWFKKMTEGEAARITDFNIRKVSPESLGLA